MTSEACGTSGRSRPGQLVLNYLTNSLTHHVRRAVRLRCEYCGVLTARHLGLGSGSGLGLGLGLGVGVGVGLGLELEVRLGLGLGSGSAVTSTLANSSSTRASAVFTGLPTLTACSNGLALVVGGR
eukprot:scaffold23835_cov60-Phaeocystis_antarctica.AAC.4